MTKRTKAGRVMLAAVAALGLAGAAAEAQVVRISGSDARNTVNFNLGYFALRGEDSRVDEDVLLVNLIGPPDGRDPFFEVLAFEISDFNGASFGGEWLYAFSDYLEAGAGINFYQRTVTSVYRNLVDSDGTEIVQDLKLRVIPTVLSVRFLPTGRAASLQPYVGAGVGIFNWRYSETGEFVDTSDGSIFTSRFNGDGNAFGPVVLAGVRGVVNDVWTVGGEVRWQRAEGDTDRETTGLVGRKIDLGGWTTSFTFGFRF